MLLKKGKDRAWNVVDEQKGRWRDGHLPTLTIRSCNNQESAAVSVKQRKRRQRGGEDKTIGAALLLRDGGTHAKVSTVPFSAFKVARCRLWREPSARRTTHPYSV